MSGKNDVIDPGIVEGYGSWSLGPHNRQRHRDSSLPPFGLQDFLDAAQDEGPRRAPFARRPRLQSTVHAVGNLNGRPHVTIVPDLWRTGWMCPNGSTGALLAPATIVKRLVLGIV